MTGVCASLIRCAHQQIDPSRADNGKVRYDDGECDGQYRYLAERCRLLCFAPPLSAQQGAAEHEAEGADDGEVLEASL
jgi:hypothetical protein